jgi:hypothetical protein
MKRLYIDWAWGETEAPIGSVAIVVTDYENGLDFWVIVFELIAILFNPLIPLYLDDKSAWMPIDIIVGTIFFIKSFPF